MSAGTATGCGTGVATNGTPVSFTTSGTAGTCIVTVAGSLNAFQLEKSAYGTSFIITGAATGTRAIDDLLQMFGGYGYMREYPIARMLTDIRGNRIYGGSSEVMKEIIGRTL